MGTHYAGKKNRGFNLNSAHELSKAWGPLLTTNGIERPIQQELKRRTQIVRVFPNTDSLLRLVTAILMEIEEKWMTKRYVTWNDEVPDLLQNQIYTDQVA